MNVDLASKLVSLRPAIEALIIRCIKEPNEMIHHSTSIEQLCHLILLLSDQQGQNVRCEKLSDQSNSTDRIK